VSVSTRKHQLRGWGLVGPGLLWTIAFFLVPLVVMAAYSLFQRTGGRIVTVPSLVNYRLFFEKPHHYHALFNSLEVAAITTVLSILLAYPLAYILAYRVPPRWQRIALVAAILPFWTSYVVRSYSWLLVLSSEGIVSRALQWVGLFEGPVAIANTRAATVLGFVHFFTMLLTLTIFANLVQIPASYRRAAADLGASAFRTFWRVTFPLSIPGVMVGAFLTVVLTLGDYITPQILGGYRELLLPQAIMLQIQRTADFPMASAMSMILMVVISAIFVLFSRWLKIERL
jgi:spermidine/putrescine transport system permease protein